MPTALSAPPASAMLGWPPLGNKGPGPTRRTERWGPQPTDQIHTQPCRPHTVTLGRWMASLSLHLPTSELGKAGRSQSCRMVECQ